MASIIKALRLSNSANSVTKVMSNLSINNNARSAIRLCSPLTLNSYKIALLHTSSRKYDLKEFFDQEKNWDKTKIIVGRSWKTDELRLKSNEDLHKLWYVLLKERNMLLTMEHACKEAYELFPSPERIDKVEESMKNIETVVRERNEAYYKLETGETGEQPSKWVWNILGMIQYHRLKQYIIPKFLNSRWRENHLFGYNGYAVRKFQRLYREKMWNIKRKARNTENNRVVAILKKFPNADLQAIKQHYPNAEIDKVLKSNKLKSYRLASRYA